MVSIVISVYNSDRHINKFFMRLLKVADLLIAKSISFEVIMVFNSPTQNELKAIKEFGDKPWFRYVAVDRETVFASWNRGVMMANGEAIAFWNVDDVRFADAIIDGLNSIKNGADLVYFPFYILWFLRIGSVYLPVKYKHILPPLYDKKEFTRSMHCGPFFMISKKFFNQVGSFDEQFKISGDFDWCVKAAIKSEKFVLSKKDAGVFRVDGTGLSARTKKNLIAENNIICKRYNILDKITN